MIEDVVLLRPLWLLAVPLALAAWLWRRRRVGSLGAWRRAIDPALLAAMAALGRVRPGAGRALWPPAALAALAALALSGPASPGAGAQTFRNLDGLALLVDVSPSMADSAPAAVAAARVLLAGAPGRGVGAVAFAGDAYAVSPFTLDHAVLARTLGVLTPGIAPDPGSRPERALRLAQARITAAGLLAADVVLIGDGGGAGPEALAAAAELRAAGVRVHALATAPEGLGPLVALAQAGGGVALPAAQAPALAARLDARLADRLRGGDFAALVWRDWGRWLLIAAMVPALLCFRRAA